MIEYAAAFAASAMAASLRECQHITQPVPIFFVIQAYAQVPWIRVLPCIHYHLYGSRVSSRHLSPSSYSFCISMARGYQSILLPCTLSSTSQIIETQQHDSSCYIGIAIAIALLSFLSFSLPCQPTSVGLLSLKHNDLRRGMSASHGTTLPLSTLIHSTTRLGSHEVLFVSSHICRHIDSSHRMRYWYFLSKMFQSIRVTTLPLFGSHATHTLCSYSPLWPLQLYMQQRDVSSIKWPSLFDACLQMFVFVYVSTIHTWWTYLSLC